MKLHLLFSSVALLSVGVMPIAVAQISFFDHTHRDQAEAAPAIRAIPSTLPILGHGSAESQQPLSRIASETLPEPPISAIPQTGIEQPLTEAKWLTQAPPALETGKEQVAQITAVRLNPTPAGLEVILETAAEFPEVLTSSAENSLITDIPNAQLRLPSGRAFRQDNPTQDIAAVEVVNLDAKTLRVTVTGKAEVPTAEVSQNPQALILSVAAPPSAELRSKPAPVAPQPTPAPTTPPPAAPAPEPPPAAPEQPPAPQTQEKPLELFVRAEEEAQGYRVPSATTGTRTDTPLRDIPQSIQVVPRKVIEDQRASSLQEVLRNVSGVTFTDSSGGRNQEFAIRGFQSDGDLVNGSRNDFYGFRGPQELANIEQIEVLKGPASVLYGRVEPGGIVNQVTKKPLFDPFYNAKFTIGSFNYYRPTLDISGPLDPGETLAYRLNLAYTNTESFRQFVKRENVLVAPALAWNITPNTTLTLLGEYLYSSQPIDRGLVAVGNQVADIPISRFLGDPTRKDETDDKRVNLFLDHQFNENWSIRSTFNASFSQEIYRSIEADFLNSDNRTLSLIANDSIQNFQTYTLQNDLIGKFKTGSVQHTLLFGIEAGKQLFQGSGSRDNEAGSIDIFDPVYEFPALQFEPSFDLTFDVTTLGVYLQDQITLLDNLKLLVGGRFDLFNQKDRNFLFDFEDTTNTSAFTPRVGIVYQPINPVSLYASFSKSFDPNFGLGANGETFEPERGTQYEAGIKADFLEGRLSATLAGYQITKSNVLTDDPNDPEFFIALGQQRSRGIELDIAGEVLPGWEVIATYAYVDARITEDEFFGGNRLNSVPFSTASLWTAYTIQGGPFRGLGFGGGVFYVDDSREIDLDNSFEIPGYARVDAAVYYRRGNFGAALNIKNLFNQRYFEGSDDITSIEPGAPTTVQGTVSWEF